MKRRHLLALPFLLGACSVVPARPYPQKRDWPLRVQRPTSLPARRGGKILLVRTLAAAPGLEDRGLHALQPDGSMQVAYYEEWISPPAQALEEALRAWIGASGLFAAILTSGSRPNADYVFEGELTKLWTQPAPAQAVASLAYAVLDQRTGTPTVKSQQAFSATASVFGTDAPALVDAQCRALADICTQVEHNLAALV